MSHIAYATTATETMVRRLDRARCSTRESAGWTSRIFPPPLTTPLLRPAEFLGTGERPFRLLPVPQLVPRHAAVVLQYSRLSEPAHPLLPRLDPRTRLPAQA